MNRIKEFRGTEPQASFVHRLDISYIRAPELSKIEQEIFIPTPKDCQRIADTLGKPLNVVFPDVIVSPESETNTYEWLANRKTENPIIPLIPVGRSNAISRKMLCVKAGMSDRTVRSCIEEARRYGHIILNCQDGCGYYVSEDLDEIARYYHQEYARARSIFARLHVMRRLLDSRQMSGQMVFRQCVRCGEPIDGGGEFCGECEK